MDVKQIELLTTELMKGVREFVQPAITSLRKRIDESTERLSKRLSDQADHQRDDLEKLHSRIAALEQAIECQRASSTEPLKWD